MGNPGINYILKFTETQMVFHKHTLSTQGNDDDENGTNYQQARLQYNLRNFYTP